MRPTRCPDLLPGSMQRPLICNRRPASVASYPAFRAFREFDAQDAVGFVFSDLARDAQRLPGQLVVAACELLGFAQNFHHFGLRGGWHGEGQ